MNLENFKIFYNEMVELDEVLSDLKEFDLDEYVYVYDYHMGGTYVSASGSREVYCETCGDSDRIINSGFVGELMEDIKKEIDEYWKIELFYKSLKNEVSKQKGEDFVDKAINYFGADVEKINKYRIKCPYKLCDISVNNNLKDIIDFYKSKDIPNSCKVCRLLSNI